MRQFQAVLKKYKKKNRMWERAGRITEGLYYIALLGICICFARLCNEPGKEKEILFCAAVIIGLCLAKTAVASCTGRNRRGIRRERSLLLTEKRGKGLMILFMGILSMAVTGTVQASTSRNTEHSFPVSINREQPLAEEENSLWVDVRNEKGQKLLIRYDAVYLLTETLKLELPLSNFTEGGIYRLRLECMDCETEETSSRTFYLKGLEP